MNTNQRSLAAILPTKILMEVMVFLVTIKFKDCKIKINLIIIILWQEVNIIKLINLSTQIIDSLINQINWVNNRIISPKILLYNNNSYSNSNKISLCSNNNCNSFINTLNK